MAEGAVTVLRITESQMLTHDGSRNLYLIGGVIIGHRTNEFLFLSVDVVKEKRAHI